MACNARAWRGADWVMVMPGGGRKRHPGCNPPLMAGMIIATLSMSASAPLAAIVFPIVPLAIDRRPDAGILSAGCGKLSNLR